MMGNIAMVRYFSTKTQRKWKSVVGLEIHAQIASNSKLFSPSSSSSLSHVNSSVSFFDASIPGTLPVLNEIGVKAGVLTALALNCKVNNISMFDRKHYFYGDMPAGYQITQQRNPLAQNGGFEFYVFTPGIHKTPYVKKVNIKQLQLEQDSGKSLHDDDRSLVDLNRAGMGLMELVFEPDLKDGEEAAALIKELSAILRRIRTCSCKMEEGAIRVDANVSIHRDGEPLGTRTEIKNISSVRGVASAVKYEIERQIRLKEEGREVVNETRSWDADSKMTVAMRDKEEKQDYRYMPEPNLPPLYLSMEETHPGSINIKNIKELIPELPNETRERFKTELGLSLEQVIILMNDDTLLRIYEEALKPRNINAKILANLMIFEFSNVINKMNFNPEMILHRVDFITDTAHLLETRQINRETARQLFVELFQGNLQSPAQIVKERNLFQITDEAELTEICIKTMEENEKLVKLYKGGKTKVFRAFMGAIASSTNQKADMAKCDQILKKLLGE